MRFYQVDPTLENYWRGVILFGNNFATYKFALAHALYDIDRSNTFISLQDLALPFSQHICAHLKQAPKQILNTTNPGPLITACLNFNNGEITQDELVQVTVKKGFNVVLKAFHNVSGGPIEKQFFIDEQRESKGILLTDDFYRLTQTEQFHNLVHETDARWSLVEKAWQMNLPPQLLDVHYDAGQQTLFTQLKHARITLTSCRNSLNGYQKGHCFYCNAPISLDAGHPLLADVDHFIPLVANNVMPGVNLNGVWNLVLACQSCNRGEQGKFARVPELHLLARLHARNEYFINSRLPLHEAIINQTGKSEPKRRTFLNDRWNAALASRLQTWAPLRYEQRVL
ncbi:HNH endonuclease [Kosakonia sp. ML.JS2a]|uniref:HNH endonuclease domain-containing protein n=1 Tax=Kosakonia sp. ML.JS2a TaxID=2980557 RepID=UPI0021D7DBA2|nr:HNH endonuclease domain-containing protein [Kosakonia sp. ML.JS2a]UXY10446.1 HNH endonuclease [Kosakonia sp. ML.JS2a]